MGLGTEAAQQKLHDTVARCVAEFLKKEGLLRNVKALTPYEAVEGDRTVYRELDVVGFVPDSGMRVAIEIKTGSNNGINGQCNAFYATFETNSMFFRGGYTLGSGEVEIEYMRPNGVGQKIPNAGEYLPDKIAVNNRRMGQLEAVILAA
ncbi:hypothetical protein ACFL1B_04940 [Nanoarchaeota archaeon]